MPAFTNVPDGSGGLSWYERDFRLPRRREGKTLDMRKGIGYALIAVAVVGGVIGLLFAVAAGGYEADAVRAAGFEFLALAAVAGIAGALILRSGRRRS